MKCKNCNHEKLDHMEKFGDKWVMCKCDFINCKCKRFIPKEKQ